MAKEEFVKLMNIWIRIVTKMNEAECTCRDYGTGDLLSPAEIHLLQAIGMNEGMNITDMASYTGVTKGAVSQMVSKLTTKDLVVKYYSPDNEKEVLLKLTPTGRTAKDGHDQHHQMIINSFERSYGDITTDEFITIEKFMLVAEKCADDFHGIVQ
ncbi:MAG TPA: MarR family transcriptional regulator [Methanocella sp.]|nr:MarR family transcriptional regulator [Methanocella sp.]